MTPRRILRTLSVSVLTAIAGATGVVQEAGAPARPSTSTTHRRQEPKASTLSVAQSFGIWMPSLAAARITLVPGGTVTSKPSIVRVTLPGSAEAGVPMSRSLTITASFIVNPNSLLTTHRHAGPRPPVELLKDPETPLMPLLCGHL